MNCLCCGKPLRGEENISGWHKSCVHRFFGTDRLPEIDISESAFAALADRATEAGFTVPGMQKKLSLHLHAEGGKARLTLIGYPAGYILKPYVEKYEAMPEAEHLVMAMAEAVGISTAAHALISDHGRMSYITKRLDRMKVGDHTEKLAAEDFCQLNLRLTQDKYRGSYEQCAKVIQRDSSRVGLDLSELFYRLVFSFLVGNSDMHLKNFSLIETAPASGQYVLSPAYDLLPVNIILPEDREEFALTMNGKKTNLHRNDFLKFADNCGITRNAAEKMIRALLAAVPRLTAMTHDSLLPQPMKAKLIELIESRAKKLTRQTDSF